MAMDVGTSMDMDMAMGDVPSDEHEVVSREAAPRPHARVVDTQLRPSHSARAIPWVLELTRSPYHVPSRELLGLRCRAARDMLVAAGLAAHLDAEE